ncbi:MAG: fibronectin type III domain-containing protein [Clostridia bacterium]|nr:fibronectin type III domain-containing protein [Clostridia bacterium]
MKNIMKKLMSLILVVTLAMSVTVQFSESAEAAEYINSGIYVMSKGIGANVGTYYIVVEKKNGNYWLSVYNGKSNYRANKISLGTFPWKISTNSYRIEGQATRIDLVWKTRSKIKVTQTGPNCAGFNMTGTYRKAENYTAPSKPYLAKAESYKNGIRLKWPNKFTSGDYVDVYRIYRNSGNGGFVPIATINATSKYSKSSDGKYVYYYDSTAKEGVRYSYKIRSYRSGKYSYMSNIKPGMYIKAPSSVSISRASFGRLSLSWYNVKGATSYKVYRKTGSSGKWDMIKTVSSDKTNGLTGRLTFRDSNVTSGKRYYYCVKAYRSGYLSEKSRTVSCVA